MSPEPQISCPKLNSKSLDELEFSLRLFQRLYDESPPLRLELRKAVINAKDRARFASRNPKAAPEKRAMKEEMLRWMLVWLDNPAVFGDWVTLRRRHSNQLGCVPIS